MLANFLSSRTGVLKNSVNYYFVTFENADHQSLGYF